MIDSVPLLCFLCSALRKGLGSLSLQELEEFVFDDLAPAERATLRTLGFRRQHGVGFLQPLARQPVLCARSRRRL